MKPVLGRTLQGKKVVSNSGLDLGFVQDAYFELGGSLVSFLIRPEQETKEVRDFVNRDGLLEIPFSEVKAIGRYIVVNFPVRK